jgi:histidinol phosphatase-like PHP family hydrolase
MHFANPFSLPGSWFKGNLHVHSTASDGKLTPDQVIDWHRRRGYHFLALTDHGVLSEARTKPNYRWPTLSSPSAASRWMA